MGKAVNTLNGFLTRAKRGQRILPTTHPVKVNLGSYLFVQPGWINVEGTLHACIANWPAALQKLAYRRTEARHVLPHERDYIHALKSGQFVHHDLDYGLPFPDNSVDYLYASHILEHFYFPRAQMLLRESFRVLKKGGRIRICVPDLKRAINLYVAGQKEAALEYFFNDDHPNGGEFHRHKYMYDRGVLEACLRKAGFETIEECTYQQGQVPDADKLDNRPEQSLYVEAAK